MTHDTAPAPERADLLESLTLHRYLLLQTAAGLTDEQARACPTESDLSVGGIIKHVAGVEQSWARFMVEGAAEEPDTEWYNPDPAVAQAWQDGFRLLESETLAEVIADYQRIAAETDRLVVEIEDLDRSFPLPPAPWFTPGAHRSVRRTILHVIAETAQHAGHADIIRETIDGAKTMA